MSFLVPADMTTEQIKIMVKQKYPQLMVKTGGAPVQTRKFKWEEDAFAAGVNLSLVPTEEQPGKVPTPLATALVEHGYVELLGASLSGIGLALILGVKQQPAIAA